MRVYIGYDASEHDAYLVARNSLFRTSGITATPLDKDKLRRAGLLWRTNFKFEDGIYDAASMAPVATDFAISRFLTPILCQAGPAIFVDCDVVFLEDVQNVMSEVDPEHAVSVVKHDYTARGLTKMGGITQTVYSRKNWSSFMVFNCDHPANARLTLMDVNVRRGIDLHQFYWLHDQEIGSLSPRWNWLVGEQPKPDNVAVAHFTLGGPWIRDWFPAEHDDIWLENEQFIYR